MLILRQAAAGLNPITCAFILLSLFVLVSALVPLKAGAEGGCPAGSYPTGGAQGGWSGCAPIPGYGEADGSGGGGVYIPQRWVAVVRHPAATDVFAVSRAETNGEAEQKALDLCYSKMGDGCEIAATYGDGSVAVVVDVYGYFWAGFGPNSGSARKAALNTCNGGGSGPCEHFKTFKSKEKLKTSGYPPNVYVPAESETLRKQSAVLVSSNPKQIGSATKLPVSVVTGQPSLSSAETAAISHCKRNGGVNCQIWQRGYGGIIAIYRMRSGKLMGYNARNENALLKGIDAYCKAQNDAPCEILNRFSVGSPSEILLHLD
jgi:Domain of unknown function (DUF4189)